MTFHGGEASSDCPTEELPRAETVCGGSSSIAYEGPPSKGVPGAQGWHVHCENPAGYNSVPQSARFQRVLEEGGWGDGPNDLGP